MSSWVRALVFAFVGVFSTLAAVFAIQGDFSAAMGALVIAALISPALLEAWCPGKYVFRKPDDGSPDNLIGRMKQFRIDHSGTDGALILGVFAMLAFASIAGAVIGLGQTIFYW